MSSPGRKTEYLILHTSASAYGDVPLIREWHIARGFTDVGYHFVIENGYPTASVYKTRQPLVERNGLVTIGRPLTVNGAHAYGYNSKSVGVCMIGRNGMYTVEQIDSAIALVAGLQVLYSVPTAKVIGHYETWSGKVQGKTCPQYEMDDFRSQLDRFRARYKKRVDMVLKT